MKQSFAAGTSPRLSITRSARLRPSFPARWVALLACALLTASHWMWYQPGGIADAFHSTGSNTFRAYLIFRVAAEDLPPPPK